MSDTVTVKALTPIRYSADGVELKNYEAGDEFEVLKSDVKQLHEAGAVAVSESIEAELAQVAPTDPQTIGAPTTVPADAPGVPVHQDGVPVAAPLENGSAPQSGNSQPTPEQIDQALASVELPAQSNNEPQV